ncbi:hypothetical protein H310_10506 [Aphanomyces invadans]|uniref:Thioredoxin domain-containing protein n=1 Tax=Aphanomyces invadans TaxID=157072 RepID=A0A024TQD5_9STRA|nr:hypothetical protein H310_10506 [Aphanomyces invadans]ETV96345.1 hypothetical protein H310_10506 [Aphanomyces invadans]|eukprot:XP_008875137.1 hypothetical protein H310_10506 [Aphanomyces invadans]
MSSKGKSPPAAHALTTMRIFQLTLALLFLSTVTYMAKFTTIWTAPSFKFSVDEAHAENLARLHEVLEMRGPNRFFVADFDAADTYLRTVNLAEGPVFVLLTSSEANGTYWCPDCEDARQPITDAFARAPTNTRLLEVSVGSPQDWKDDFNPFRTRSLFHIRKIPSLLKYDGDLKTSQLLSETFAMQPALLDFVFKSKPRVEMSHPASSYKTIRDGNEMLAFLEAYQGDYPLFLYFTSGIKRRTGRPWCPYCDIADVPLHFYFDKHAPKHAVLLTLVVADSFSEWKDRDNPFRQQSVAPVRAVPTLSRVVRASPTDPVSTRTYSLALKDIQALQSFFESPH